MNSNHFKFTKTSLMEVSVPAGGRTEVFDTEVRGLACRISHTGRMTMLINKKVAGRPTRRKLGIYIPGIGSKTVDDYRAMARSALSKIQDDPVEWTSGGTPLDSAKITLADAFDMALKHTKRGERGRKDWEKGQEKFLAWMRKNSPACEYWKQLTRATVRAYHDSWETQADNTIRIAFQCIRQTSRFMLREYDLPDVAVGFGVGTKLTRPPVQVLLPDVVDFIDWLKDHSPELEAMAAMQGLCGLRLQEASRMTWNMIDLKNGLIEVGAAGAKNEYSHRCIPICERAKEALQRASNAKVQSVDGRLYPYHWMNYSKDVTQAIRAFGEEKIDWKPKDLRNTLLQFAIKGGLHNDLWEQYIGHAPKSISAKHYMNRLQATTRGQKEELDEHMSIFRQQVTSTIDQAIKADRAKKATEAKKEGKRGCTGASLSVWEQRATQFPLSPWIPLPTARMK